MPSDRDTEVKCLAGNPWFRWFARMMCTETRRPLHHSWQCVRCGMVFDD